MLEKIKRKDNGGLGSFNIAPDFPNGGVYKSLNVGDVRFDAPVFTPAYVPQIDNKNDLPF